MGRIVDELITQARERLVALGFQPSTMQQYKVTWNKVKRWCDLHRVDHYDSMVEQRILEELGLNGANLSLRERDQLRHIRTLLSAEEHGGLPPLRRRSAPSVPDRFQHVFESYVSFLERRDLSPSTRSNQAHRIRIFLRGLSIEAFSDLSMADVTSHMEACEKMGAQTRAGVLYMIRAFARWAANEGFCSPAVAAAMPVIPGHKHSALPSAYAAEEIAKVVAHPGMECPKRDRAMLLLAAVLGLRAGEMRSLRLEHIDLRAEEIRFTQPKTGQTVRLPLPEEVLLAIADYLRNERPESDDVHVFLHHRAPHHCFERCAISFHHVATAAYDRAGVDTTGKHHGMHSLRHSAATNMLADGTPYPVISGVLGHTNANTTRKYMAVDTTQLRSICLEVPRG